MATVHLTITDLPGGQVNVHSSFEPHVGAPTTPAQGLSLDLCSAAAHAGHSVVNSERYAPLLALANRILDPEHFGHAVTQEVRIATLEALGRTRPGTRKAAGELMGGLVA